MTVTTTLSAEVAEEVAVAAHQIADATVEYIARLNELVDIRTLTTGAHGFDFAVGVRSDGKLDLLPRLADLTFDIESRFGVPIKTLAVTDNSLSTSPEPVA
jgi:hypothetical protein